MPEDNDLTKKCRRETHLTFEQLEDNFIPFTHETWKNSDLTEAEQNEINGQYFRLLTRAEISHEEAINKVFEDNDADVVANSDALEDANQRLKEALMDLKIFASILQAAADAVSFGAKVVGRIMI